MIYMHDNESYDSELNKQKKPKLSHTSRPVVEYYPNASSPHEMAGNMNYPTSCRSIHPVECSYSLHPEQYNDNFISSRTSSPRHQQQKWKMVHHYHHNSSSSDRKIRQHHYPNQTNRGLHYDPHIAWNMPEQSRNQHQILREMSMEEMYRKGYVMVPIPISQISSMPRSVQALARTASERTKMQRSRLSNQMSSRNYHTRSPPVLDDFEDIVHNIMSSTELLENNYRKEEDPSVAVRQESFQDRGEFHKNIIAKSDEKMDRSSQTPQKVKSKKKSSHQESPPNVRRPLTAYNYFFSVERDLVLKIIEYAEKSCVTETIANPDDISYFVDILSKTHLPQDELEAHKKSAHLKIQDMLNVHFISDKVKVPHRKIHGKITFRTLGKLIGIRWRNLSREDKMYYFDLAKKDSERFQNQLNNLRNEFNNVTAEKCDKARESVNANSTDSTTNPPTSMS